MKFLHTIMAAAVAGLVAGCSSIDCNIEGRVLCHYGLQDSEGNDVTLAYPMSITFHRTAAESDTVYINQMSNVTSFDLPMSYDAETDEIDMTLHLTDPADTTGMSDQDITDIIRITKTNTPQFESVDCSPRYHHSIVAVSSTHNFIDTVIVNNSKVSNDASVTNIHIRLYGSGS